MSSVFDPQPYKYPYPRDTAEHYLQVKQNRGIVFDENYPYIDKSEAFKKKQFWVRVLCYTIVFPLTKIRMGLKVHNKRILKENKDLLAKGAISISNHVNLWDYLAIMKTIKPVKPYILSWADNINDASGPLVRLVGGIPIPTHNLKATCKQLKEVGEMLEEGGWLHIYPEGSMWEYYCPIRPFKKGFDYLAAKYQKPIIPMAFSYRQASWIRRTLFNQPACFTLNIGEPLYRNPAIDPSLQSEDLIKRAHEQVCLLAGINPKDNVYEAIYHKSQRVDYYTSDYCVTKTK